MDKKATGIVAYLTIVGWVVAYCAGDKEGAKFHLNQALVLVLGEVVLTVMSYIPLIGGIVSGILGIVLFIFWIMGFVYACKGEEKEVPLIGGIRILK